MIDSARFRLDSFPSLDYQPLPWMGKPRARRADGVASRWDVMRPIITDAGVETAVDIGCNVGFFPVSLTKLGITTVGVEGHPKYFRLFRHTRARQDLQNLGCLNMQVTPDTVELLPKADCVLLLAIWHHFVKHYGLESATTMLRTIWSRAGRMMFFETGETEMTPDWGLPDMLPDPRAFIEAYLGEHCEGGTVQHLGVHKAFSPVAHKVVDRNLFVVFRGHA